jgi:hypothetical protein
LNETLQSADQGGRSKRATVWRWLLLGAVVVAVVVVAAVVVDRRGSNNSTSNTSGAVATSPADLAKLGHTLGQPIYWIGPEPNVTYERTLPGNGRITLRYLPAGTDVGTSTPYLTVGTYTLPDAYAATQRAASKPGAIRIQVKASASAIAFSTKARPLNAWITYPGSRYQIEVFDPTPGRARRLVASGAVKRVPGTPIERRPVLVTPKGISRVATAAQRPIYWAGPQANQTYELTKTSQGGYQVRYLSPGNPVGVPTPHLTVGTYPFRNALAAIRRLSRAKGASLIKLTGGGLAVVSPQFPTSVYLSWPGVNYEVEVYDPSLARARQLVTSGLITTVP